MANEIQMYDNKGLIAIADNYLNNEAKGIVLPQNYDYRNAVSMLYLKCVAATTADGKPVLEVCTPDSIRRTVQEMVSKGLNPAKNQCYAIAYAVKDKNTKQVLRYELQLQESYFGRVKRVYEENPDVVRNSINAQCIYKGDDFAFKIEDGRRVVTKHEQKFENINDANIVGAYATVRFKDGTTKTELMTAAEIKRSWAMSRTSGEVHGRFSHEMCCKTVESRLCKHLSNSTNDGGAMGYEEDGMSINEDGVIDLDDIPDAEVPEQVETIEAITEAVTSEEADSPVTESAPTPQPALEATPACVCAQCGKSISEKIYNYSKRFFGRPLCYKCQPKDDNE